MSSSGTIRIKAVWAMLDECAQGWSKVETLHNWRLTYGAYVYEGFPVGERGKHNPEIEKGHVRHVVRLFKIGDCAKRVLPQIR